MLVSAVLGLHPKGDVVHTALTGSLVYDWFFEWIETVDADRCRALRVAEQAKPFALSNIMRLRDGTYCVRITALEKRLAAWLGHHLHESLPSAIGIGGADYGVAGVWTDPGRHRWAGRTTYRDLVDRYLGGRDPGRKISLYFASPTAFHSRGHNVPLPLPDLVFGSLASRWHAYAPIVLDNGIRKVAAAQVLPNCYSLRTEAVRVKGGLQVGFVGRCEFTVLAENPYWRRVYHLLSAFAFYSGVGRKTALGLGQVRYSTGERSWT
jgi:CRISPR-associated endoribonuclease Cas6